MANCLKCQETEFIWKVCCFNMCTQIAKEGIHSPKFNLDSSLVTNFKLQLYPRGREIGEKQSVSLYLEVPRKEIFEGYDLNIQVKIFVDDEDRSPISNIICQISNLEKIKKYLRWKIASIDRDRIFKNADIFSHVDLRIVLNINLIKKKEKPDNIWMCTVKDLEILSSDLSRALEDPKHFDFILKSSGDKCFKVHKPILMFRYPTLSNALRLENTTTKKHRLWKKEVTLKYMLQYLYTGKIDVENIPCELYDILYENNLPHLQYLIFPVPESTTAETKIKIRNGCLTWTIPDFINLPKTTALSSFLTYESSLKWTKVKITCYFRLNEKNEDWVTFSINRIFPDHRVYMACKVQIVGLMEYIREYDHTFLNEAEWVLPPYVSTQFLNDNKHTLLPSGTLTIKFQIQMSDGNYETEVSHIQSPNIIVSQDKTFRSMNLCALQGDLRKLYKDPILSDVALHVDGEIFHVHKVILSARSAVFSKMFEHETLEQQTSKIVIKDFKPAVVQAMLSHMYCGEVDNVPDNLNFVMDLYAIADKYDLSELKAKCVTYFKSVLDANNAGKLLVLADTHYDSHLKMHVKNFVCTNPKIVPKPEEWDKIMHERPDLATDTLNAVLSFIAGENKIHLTENNIQEEFMKE